MRQTMIGLLALMASMLISLNVQRASLSAQLDVIHSEMETIAGGVALDVLEHVGLKAFDEETKDGNTVESPEDLTPLPFSTGKHYEDADDLDDFNEMQTYVITEFDFDFEVDIRVEYVDEDDPEQVSTTQTFVKKVTVTVGNANLPQPVQIAYVYAYP